MHELALCQAIAESAEERAAGRPVSKVNVRIGYLRQVVPDSLTFAWDLLIEDTDLAGSVLEVDHVPAVVVCGECGESTTLEWPVLACVPCGSHDVQLIGGDELLLVSLELAPPTPPPPGRATRQPSGGSPSTDSSTRSS